MLRPAILLLLLGPIALPAQAGRVEHLRHGDTTIVRTTGNGVWGSAHDAVEVARIGGESKETTFGRISRTVALPNGGVLVFDEKGLDGPALRMFDPNGKFLRTIGRSGEGPGEYRPLAPFIAVAGDGTILLRQVGGLLNRYRADGTFLNAFRIATGGGGMLDVFPATGRSIFVRAGLPSGDRDPLAPITDLPMRRYDSLGKVLDSIQAPTYLTEPSLSPFAPREWWNPLTDGRMLATRTDRVGFLLRSGAGGRTLLLADIVTQAPLFLPEERKEQQALMDFQHENLNKVAEGRYPAIKVPERKMLSTGGALIAPDGRIWIRRTATGVKGPARVVASYALKGGEAGQISASYADLPVYSAFLLDGTYLGDVRFPPNVTGISFTGDMAWGVLKTEDDEQFLVKYRLH